MWPKGLAVDLSEGMSVGGGRGVRANRSIPCGQLLLTEIPLVTVPRDKSPNESLHVSLARALLQDPRCDWMLKQVAHLHPVQLTDIPPASLQSAKQHYASDVERLMKLLPIKIKNASGPLQPTSPKMMSHDHEASEATIQHGSVDENTVLRLILAVQCNAFYSGFYVLCSMFNHACNPNCIKLARPDGSSEVRAVRPIAAGEECTISYLSPPFQSFGRRRQHLLEQHYFVLPSPSSYPDDPQYDAACSLAVLPELLASVNTQDNTPHVADTNPVMTVPVATSYTNDGSSSERGRWHSEAGVSSSLNCPASYVLAAGQYSRIAAAGMLDLAGDLCSSLNMVEDQLDALEGKVAVLASEEDHCPSEQLALGNEVAPPNTTDGCKDRVSSLSGILKEVQALQKQALQVLSSYPLNVVLARINSLTVQVCRLSILQEDYYLQTLHATAPTVPAGRVNGSSNAAADKATTQTDPRVPNALLLLESGEKLLAMQETVLGSEHYEVALTLQAIFQTLGFMLSAAPKQLFASSQPGSSMSTFSKASAYEARIRRKHASLTKMYSSPLE
ncbi:hypothetical protein CEUSTIGMA_g6788.t1 [Chlamydomonas eustigma]|uniref:SET domain-containing protein n=1 Tax=Chlamydomonas eustigma TaxID=1157962 RepID=A0A250X8G0_9CHLO|nr:hypothetical protein CEUSTIGMA_g6788.t1 [Chlamydomonas eustigma]|eukprot:GAX79346.1 hypothetical protein CEUSTIGMA_g6788.t1 [Chlamydomonas eustigma]